MKNIFKLMGIALLASSMIFVSCKKDNTTDEPIQTIPDGVNVTFNGESWTAAVSQCTHYTAQTAMQFSAMKSDSEQFPAFDEVIYSDAVGTTTETTQEANMGQFTDDNTHGWVEYYKEGALQDQNGHTFGDWWASEATTDIKALDLTALKVTAVMEGTFFSALEAWVGDNAVGMANASKAPYKATFGNVELTNK